MKSVIALGALAIMVGAPSGVLVLLGLIALGILENRTDAARIAAEDARIAARSAHYRPRPNPEHGEQIEDEREDDDDPDDDLEGWAEWQKILDEVEHEPKDHEHDDERDER